MGNRCWNPTFGKSPLLNRPDCLLGEIRKTGPVRERSEQTMLPLSFSVVAVVDTTTCPATTEQACDVSRLTGWTIAGSNHLTVSQVLRFCQGEVSTGNHATPSNP